MTVRELVVKLAEDLITKRGLCKECGYGHGQYQFHHANCPIGRLILGGNWKELRDIRRGFTSKRSNT